MTINLKTGTAAAVPATAGDIAELRADLGLGNVDNTSDINKPVSAATTAAIAAAIAAIGGTPVVVRAINSFAPASGPVGTVVTFYGTGLAGVTSALMGANATAAAVSGVSATQVSVTIPAGMTSGPCVFINAPNANIVTVTAFTVGALPVATGFVVTAAQIYNGAGARVQIRGISHYGFNADILCPQYLWQMDWKAQLAQIASLGFNAVRCPFTPDTLYSTTQVDAGTYLSGGPGNDLWAGLTPLLCLDLWMAEADRLGLHILLDFHSVSNHSQYQTWFLDNPADFGMMWNGVAYSQADWIRDLVFVANRYRALPHFMAIDVDNEPNGIVRWDVGDSLMTQAKYYWRPAVEAAAAAILASNPNLLIFVQGSGGNDYNGLQPDIGINWGENFQSQAQQPLNVPANKLVLSPHTYGPDVSVKTSFSAPNFPANLAADWETLFGQFYPAHAVIIGEWGGKYGAGTGGLADKTWQDALVTWLLSKGITDSFYWCYTPNSGDTGGILDDSLVVIPAKMTLLHRLWGV